MQDLEQILKSCYSKDLEQRKHWYGSVADDYNKVRPRYPQNLIDRVVEFAQLSDDATILLEEVTVQRCRVLLGQKERVRGLTSYHWWLEAIN